MFPTTQPNEADYLETVACGRGYRLAYSGARHVADNFRDFEEVPDVSCVQEGDVAAWLDAPRTYMIEHAGEAFSGVAILPTLTLIGAAAGVVARPIAGRALTRFVYSCRLDTSRVPTAVVDLEQCLNEAVADVILGGAERLN